MASIRTGIELNDGFSQVIYSIINAVNMAASSMEAMQRTMGSDVDTSGIEGVHDAANQATLALDELINRMHEANSASVAPQVDTPTGNVVNTDSPVTAPQVQTPSVLPTPVQANAPPVRVPLEWDVQDIPVFTGTGVERYQQEVAAASDQLQKLIQTQEQISRSSAATNILPVTAYQDVTRMTNRIRALSSQIDQISKVNVGDEASSQIEQLRGQLNQAIRAQTSLNTAMASGDASGIVESYNQLNNAVSNTERYIRDNTDEQGRFNTAIQEGSQQADQLTGMIAKAAGAYLSIKSVGEAIDISDELVSTTARLNTMNESFNQINGTAVETDSLVKQIYASAQNARGSFGDMAAVVAKFGNNARDAFANQDEVVAFANIVQKQMTIAGASTQEASNAMLQLSQALGSGVLRGDELNSIFEQAPNLIQSIADYLDVPIGQIRSMASEGKLSADVVKSAIFAAAEDSYDECGNLIQGVNSKFESMPLTWAQNWQQMQNTALMAFQPVLNRINELANSPGFQNFANGAIQAMAIIANQVLNIFDLIGQVAQFVSDNWSVIEPIVLGVAGALGTYAIYLGIVEGLEIAGAAASLAYNLMMSAKIGIMALMNGTTMAATAAQMGYNGALYACPVVWFVIAIIAIIAAVYAVCSAIAKMTGVANSGFGVIVGAVYTVIAFFKNLFSAVGTVFSGIGAGAVALGNNIKAAFHNSIATVKAKFYSLLSTAMTVISQIASALSALPFVEFDAAGLAGKASDYAAKAQEANDSKMEYQDIGAAFQSKMDEMTAFSDGWASDAFAAGAAKGDSIAESISNFDLSSLLGATELPDTSSFDMSDTIANGISDSGLGDSSGSTSDNTGKIASSVTASEEDLKYLREIAEQETVNRYTLASVNVDMSGMTNHVNNGMDLDGVVSGLTDAVEEAIESMTEGVHS